MLYLNFNILYHRQTYETDRLSRCSVNKKHKTPSLGDEIWRLNKIARDGKRHKKLVASGIQTVNDLLLQYAMNPSNIRKVRDSYIG